MNDVLYDTYRIMRGLGITKSANHFSIEFLGRSKRLYSWILSSGHKPPLDVMVRLYAKIDDLCSEAKATGDIAKAELFELLTDRIWSSVRTESLTMEPNRRSKRIG